MEQLAHFVTKSFEYNNNRVLDVINMSTKSLIYEKSSDSEVHSNGGDSIGGGIGVDEDDEDDTMDIDITDLSSSDDVIRKMDTDISDNNNVHHLRHSPLALVKKGGKDSKRYVTKNWLISDSPKRMGGNDNGKKHMGFQFCFFFFGEMNVNQMFSRREILNHVHSK